MNETLGEEVISSSPKVKVGSRGAGLLSFALIWPPASDLRFLAWRKRLLDR